MSHQIYEQQNPRTDIPTPGRNVVGTCAGLTLEWARNVAVAQGHGVEQLRGTKPNITSAVQTQVTWATAGANAAFRNSEVQLGQKSKLGTAEQGFAQLASSGTSTGIYLLTLTAPNKDQHMVGVMKQERDNFLYFEPNAGLFLCTSADDFTELTKTHLRTTFPTAGRQAVRMSAQQLLGLNQTPYPATPPLDNVSLPRYSDSPPRPQQGPSNLQPQQSTHQDPPGPRQRMVPPPDHHTYPPQPHQSISESHYGVYNMALPRQSAQSLGQQVSSDPRSQIAQPEAAYLLQEQAMRGQSPQQPRRPQQRHQHVVDTQPRGTAQMSMQQRHMANTGTQEPEQSPNRSCCRR